MTETGTPPSIQVNGEEEAFVVDSLAALLAQKDIDRTGRGVAVALNGRVIPRAAWQDTPLEPGDKVEIVRARQGG